MLTIRNLKKSYGGQTLFEEADLQVNYGERVALVGPNGAGKSTIFRIILGEEESDKGSVERDEWTLTGFLPQESEDVGDYTVIEIATGRAGMLQELEATLKRLEDAGDVSCPEYLEADGKFNALNDPKVEAKAKEMLRGLGYKEEDPRGIWQVGNAVFMRNWPYAWALAQAESSPIRGKVGVVALPAGPGGESAATLGGWQLAVSRYSKNPEAAKDLVRYLTSAKEQKRRAIKGSVNPTIMALYDDPDVLAANPFFGTLSSAFKNAVARPARPAGARYNQVSDAIWRASYDVLQGDKTGKAAMEDLEEEIARIAYRARWAETKVGQ